MERFCGGTEFLFHGRVGGSGTKPRVVQAAPSPTVETACGWVRGEPHVCLCVQVNAYGCFSLDLSLRGGVMQACYWRVLCRYLRSGLNSELGGAVRIFWVAEAVFWGEADSVGAGVPSSA